VYNCFSQICLAPSDNDIFGQIPGSLIEQLPDTVFIPLIITN
jgi:hypothetical protein